ncbi:MAG: SH3 domain-containing protein [Clostridia bacterium]|nr:SH3 domain-containing protein [Clostridia bacterium]
MSKILAAQAAAMFEEIIGWPYRSPGTNDSRGIDCSGAWVRVYQRYGKTIAHGSNSQYRLHCGQKGALSASTPLCVGMAVFKRRFDGQEPAQFRGDGLGNLYHVGCLTRVSPIRVVHATTPNAKVDTSIGAWTHWGLLTEVEYSSTLPPPILIPPGPVDPGPGQAGQAIVNTQQTGLRLRKEPSLSGAPICEMPKGSILTVIDRVTGWTKVRYVAPSGMLHIGWCSTDYLRFL